MIIEPDMTITLAASGLAGLGIVTAATLSGWRSWLSLKRQELEGRTAGGVPEVPAPSATTRIEMADLKERIRKLEAIAAGVDL